MIDNPVRWFEIYVQDMARAKSFYESVFQVKLEKLNTPDAEIEMWAFPMQMGRMGITGSLVKMNGVPSGGNSTLVYFACEDCAVEAARIAQFGGRVERAKFSIGEYGFIALTLDSEGNMIGLHSMQ
ncbi:VOC family protein [Propionivibrio sp.]|uniref:VOC family protein n=1 Tax=Propionivibrio sp. TaxID=2212460 RepID=UPI002637664E|nr:VOC family protein [Propionivibrio sp.]